METDKVLEIGKVTKPQGIRGEVRIQPETDTPEDFLSFRHAYVLTADGTRYPVLRSRVHDHVIVASLDGIRTRNDAEKIRNCMVCISRKDAPEPDEGSYYIADLIGCTVLDTEGRIYGQLEEVMQPGGNDVLVIRDGGAEYLMPMIRALNHQIDLDAKRITVDAVVAQEVTVVED